MALSHMLEEVQTEVVTISTVIHRGVEAVMPEEGLREVLAGNPIRLYLGIDPTSPNLHIGHMVPLRKLAQLQQLGHHVILLFGTFTGMIGDPSDKSAARVRLTPEQVDANVATYKEQAGMILDLSANATNPVEIVFNHEWLQPLTFMEVVELAANFTVNQFVARSTYANRLAAGTPLYLHEFLYPLMQGYDSVALNVQLEIGGKDQVPNMLAGTTLVRQMLNTQKWVIGMKLIEDPSGAKMGKTSGNVVNITEWPEVIYEALMTWPDGAIPVGLELLTSVPMELVKSSRDIFIDIAQGTSDENPMELKEAFAWRVVSELLSADEADIARQIFDEVKRKKKLPRRLRTVEIQGEAQLKDALVVSGLATDVGEAQSLLTQQAVKLDHHITGKNFRLQPGEYVIELGKRSIKNVRRIVVK